MKKRYVVFGLSLVLAVSLSVPALGGPSNPIATGAASAKKTAKKALKKAKKANKKAKQAQKSADNAQISADNAQSSADGAQSTADGAQTAADNAQSTADGAQSAADAAQATANAAFSDVDFEEGDTSPTDSSASKTVAAGCISGYEPTGGGFVVNGAGNNDVTQTLSSQYLNGWIVNGEEVTGTGATWNITATVNCID